MRRESAIGDRRSEGSPGLASSPAYRLLETLASGESISPAAVAGVDLASALGELRCVGYAIAEEGERLRLATGADAIDRAELQSLLKTRDLGRRIGCYVEVGSTNDLAMSAARDGAPHGSVILAEYQAEGRGRSGRRWQSRPNVGLWFSVIIRSEQAADVAAFDPWRLTLGAGAAVVRGIAEAAGLRSDLKWPNDVRVSGRKVAGILCEAGRGLTVVGIGLNVNQDRDDFAEDLRSSATSLKIEGGRAFRRAEILAGILLALENVLGRDGEAIRDAWLSAWGDAGRRVRVVSGDRAFEGIAADLAEDGGLMVKTESGWETVYAGDVTVVWPG